MHEKTAVSYIIRLFANTYDGKANFLDSENFFVKSLPENVVFVGQNCAHVCCRDNCNGSTSRSLSPGRSRFLFKKSQCWQAIIKSSSPGCDGQPNLAAFFHVGHVSHVSKSIKEKKQKTKNRSQSSSLQHKNKTDHGRNRKKKVYSTSHCSTPLLDLSPPSLTI